MKVCITFVHGGVRPRSGCEGDGAACCIGCPLCFQSQGLGKLRPNTLLLGFKNNWQMVDPRSVHNYVGIIQSVFIATSV